MPVKEKSRQQLTALSEPLLEPGDRILHMVVAQVGKTPVKKNVAAVALSITVAAAASALGAGTSMVGEPRHVPRGSGEGHLYGLRVRRDSD